MEYSKISNKKDYADRVEWNEMNCEGELHAQIHVDLFEIRAENRTSLIRVKSIFYFIKATSA